MQSASAVLMIRPAAFGFNETTAASNFFQKKSSLSAAEVQTKAAAEFDGVVKALRREKIDVEVFDDTAAPKKPDAVFPNNWVAFHLDGSLFLFPMEAPNRRPERRADIVGQIQKHYRVTRVIDYSESESKGKFLEGTGSMVLDHLHHYIYAVISVRTDLSLLKRFAKEIGYSVFPFHAFDGRGAAIYHTNVMLSLGTNFAVVCFESITDLAERKKIAETLGKSGRTIIEITLAQVDQFVGNMLELTGKTGKKLVVMSDQASRALTPKQRSLLEDSAKIISVAIPTIETVGGGSLRCMLAEIFLPPI